MSLVNVLHERRQDRRRDTGHQARLALDHDHLHPAPTGGCRDFETDVAAADHDQAPPRLKLRLDGIGIGDRPQRVDTGQILALDPHPSRTRAGRENQNAIGQALARREGSGLRGPVDRDNACVQPQRDVALVVERLRPQPDGREGDVALEPRL